MLRLAQEDVKYQIKATYRTLPTADEFEIDKILTEYIEEVGGKRYYRLAEEKSKGEWQVWTGRITTSLPQVLALESVFRDFLVTVADDVEITSGEVESS